jgi:hypothetical protein
MLNEKSRISRHFLGNMGLGPESSNKEESPRDLPHFLVPRLLKSPSSKLYNQLSPFPILFRSPPPPSNNPPPECSHKLPFWTPPEIVEYWIDFFFFFYLKILSFFFKLVVLVMVLSCLHVCCCGEGGGPLRPAVGAALTCGATSLFPPVRASARIPHMTASAPPPLPAVRSPYVSRFTSA